MKRRHRFLFNLCAIVLLAFSLYLNFVKKDPPDASVPHGFVKATPSALNGEAQKTSPVKKDTGAIVASK